ncbi:hypothetical protein X798_03859 [Onchocerca flexuosa]|uniref:Protein kinase domain-containing protein n=1 Tax=Onchocerca flexuosa TaxID=387005 RepID=A0A238BV21_9BILA|nr:hypothetical protein X798_03859 [Onchocerca flexuosa]
MPLFRKDKKGSEERLSIYDYYEFKDVLGTGAFSKFKKNIERNLQMLCLPLHCSDRLSQPFLLSAF